MVRSAYQLIVLAKESLSVQLRTKQSKVEQASYLPTTLTFTISSQVRHTNPKYLVSLNFAMPPFQDVQILDNSRTATVLPTQILSDC